MEDEVVIRFRLVGDEARALRVWSTEQVRRPRDQLLHILRKELMRQGYLAADRNQVNQPGQEARDGQ